MRIKFEQDNGGAQGGGQSASATPVNEGGQKPSGQVVTDDKKQATDGSDQSKQVDPNAVAKAAAEPGKEPAKEPAKDPAAESKEEPLELKLPEGAMLDATAVEDVKAFAKEHGLNGKQAQALLEKQNAAISAHQAREIQKFEQVKASWIDQTQADQEIGGQNFSKAAELAKRAYDRWATPEFKTLLQKTGAENHPEFVRVFYRIGKTMDDAEFRGGGGQTSAKEPRAADIIFGEKSGG